MGDHKLPAMPIRSPADLRMRSKHRYGSPNLDQRGARGCWGVCEKKLNNALEILERLVRID